MTTSIRNWKSTQCSTGLRNQLLQTMKTNGLYTKDPAIRASCTAIMDPNAWVISKFQLKIPPENTGAAIKFASRGSP
jgi:hypothetical protein